MEMPDASEHRLLPIKFKEGPSIDMTPNDSIPYIDDSGTIIIPFNADPKYHYWKGGQHLSDTMMELNVPENIWRNHTVKPYPGDVV
jgi:hypothetical protein